MYTIYIGIRISKTEAKNLSTEPKIKCTTDQVYTEAATTGSELTAYNRQWIYQHGTEVRLMSGCRIDVEQRPMKEPPEQRAPQGANETTSRLLTSQPELLVFLDDVASVAKLR